MITEDYVMKRKEEIIKTARQKEKKVGFSQFVCEAKGVNSAYGIGFLEGAEWADLHPNLYNMNIEISQEDYEFLKDLQRELNTQTNDCNADPVFWGVEETVEECRGDNEDFGGDPYISFDDGKWTLEEAIEVVENDIEYYDNDVRDEWNDIDKTSICDVYEFISNTLKWNNVYGVIYVESVERISPYTGAFITKRACKEYIKKYGYNHNNPHTYAMTVYRNFELERLIKILKTMNFKDSDNGGKEAEKKAVESIDGLKYRNLEITINDCYKTTTEEI